MSKLHKSFLRASIQLVCIFSHLFASAPDIIFGCAYTTLKSQKQLVNQSFCSVMQSAESHRPTTQTTNIPFIKFNSFPYLAVESVGDSDEKAKDTFLKDALLVFDLE